MYDLEAILNHVPHGAKPQITSYLNTYKVAVVITRQRHTKHGDFRNYSNGNTQITINKMTNPYRFLITLVHELAHLETFKSFGRSVKPHGLEWKQKFRLLMLPFLNPTVFPEPLLSVVAHHLKNPKASSDTDFELVMALKNFDPETAKIDVFELKEGTHFSMYNGNVFIRGKKRVKRYECKEVQTGRTYLFSPHAEVTPIHL